MRSQPDRDGSTDGRADLENGRDKGMTATTTSSIPSSVIQASRLGTGTETHHSTRPSLFQGQRSFSDGKLTDDLLRSPTLQSRRQSQLEDTELPVPVETAVWDWQPPAFGATTTPLGNSDQSSAYFYEPQGELLLRQFPGIGGVRAHEFNIPGPVVHQSPNREQPAGNPFESFLSNTSNPDNGNARIGVKRKSAPDLYHTAAKRPTLDMGETDRAGQHVNTPSGKATPVVDRRALSASQPSASVLPARKVFPIQIGDKLFRLSGASISSDGK